MAQLNAKYFKKMISGDKNYLPGRVSKKLKASGMSQTLYGKTTKEKATKAVRHLQEKGLLPKTKAASQLFSQAAKQQAADQEAIRQAQIQKHVRANIKIDISEEISAEEQGKKLIDYDPRSVLGKSLADDINQKSQTRDHKIQAERKKVEEVNQKKPGHKKEVRSVDLANLPDMDIG